LLPKVSALEIKSSKEVSIRCYGLMALVREKFGPERTLYTRINDYLSNSLDTKLDSIFSIEIVSTSVLQAIVLPRRSLLIRELNQGALTVPSKRQEKRGQKKFSTQVVQSPLFLLLPKVHVWPSSAHRKRSTTPHLSQEDEAKDLYCAIFLSQRLRKPKKLTQNPSKQLEQLHQQQQRERNCCHCKHVRQRRTQC
jgi:hypothetical protein